MNAQTHHDHPLLQRQTQAEPLIEALISEVRMARYTCIGLIRRAACAGHIVHIHADRVPDAVREERAAHAARDDRLLGVPRARARRLGREEDAELLEAAHQRAVAQQLDRVPVQARPKRSER